MTVLCGLAPKFEHLIVAIDVVSDDSSLTMEFLKSHLIQEEQRLTDRAPTGTSGDSALVNKTHLGRVNRPPC